MTAEHYAKIWCWVGLFAFAYAANTWLVSQGANGIFGAALMVDGRHNSAIWALFLLPLLMHVVFAAGWRYSALRNIGIVEALTPMPFFEGVNRSRLDARIVAAFFFFVVSVFPLLSCIHFVNIAKDGQVCLVESNTNEQVVSWEKIILGKKTLAEDSRKEGYWFGTSPAEVTKTEDKNGASYWTCKMEKKVSWYPWFNWFLPLWLFAMVVHFGLYVFLLLRRTVR